MWKSVSKMVEEYDKGTLGGADSASVNMAKETEVELRNDIAAIACATELDPELFSTPKASYFGGQSRIQHESQAGCYCNPASSADFGSDTDCGAARQRISRETFLVERPSPQLGARS